MAKLSEINSVTTVNAQILAGKDIDGQSATNDSRIALPKADTATLDALTDKEGVIAYDTDKGVVVVNDGTDFNVVGGSPGNINYVENGSFETDVITGVTAGGGTAPTIATETGSPLFGNQSAQITSGAGTGYVDFTITGIDNAVIDGQILNQVTAYLKTDAAVADGDWTIGIYNTTDAIYATTQTNLVADQLNVHTAAFVPVTGKTYVLRAEFTDTTAGRVLIADKLKVTPEGNSSTSELITGFDYEDTFTNLFDSTGSLPGFGTIEQNFVRWKRIGNEMVAVFLFDNSSAGSNGVGTYFLNIPGGLTVDPSVYTSTEGHMIVGQYMYTDDINGHIRKVNNALVYGDTGPNKIGFRYHSNTDDTNAWTAGGTPTFFNANLRVGGQFRIPILEWSNNKVNLITQDLVTANARAHFYYTGSSTLGENVTLPFNAELYNEGGGFSNSAGVITFNFTGKVHIEFVARYQADLSNTIRPIGRLGGSVSMSGNDNNKRQTTFSGILDVTVGQTFDATANGAAPTALGGGGSHDVFIVLSRIADYGALTPAGFGLATDTNFGLIKMAMKDYSASSWSELSSFSVTFNDQKMFLKIYETDSGTYADLTIQFYLTSISGSDNLLLIDVADLNNFVKPNVAHNGTDGIQGQPEFSSNTAILSPEWRTDGRVAWTGGPSSPGIISLPDARQFTFNFINVPVTLQ